MDPTFGSDDLEVAVCQSPTGLPQLSDRIDNATTEQNGNPNREGYKHSHQANRDLFCFPDGCEDLRLGKHHHRYPGETPHILKPTDS